MRRRVLTTTVSVLLIGAAVTPLGSSPSAAAPASSSAPGPAEVVLVWEENALDTIYVDNASPPPVGLPYLGFTSVAMYDAVHRARRAGGSTAAAIAVAAHHVLVEYFPASEAELDGELATSLGAIPDGTEKTQGRRAGGAAARAMIRSRSDDGRGDTSIVYDREAAPGVWPAVPAPPEGGMLAPWLGFVDPLLDPRPIPVDGPDPLTSPRYATDYLEVKRTGSTTSTHRSPYMTDTAYFFAVNPIPQLANAIIALLRDQPMGLRSTAHLFATMHGAATDAVITCWRLKYHHAYWRPYQAIAGADADGNPATVPEDGWAPLVANPPYPDYTSGHGCVTSSHVGTVRRVLGEETELTLTGGTSTPGVTTMRSYSTLHELEHDAFNARIWGGLHFRDAMEDAYSLGHRAAGRALRALP